MAGPLVLFPGLLTLKNAPFDWASLGLTRALLRRGLELGGWWPMILALVDAAAAALIVAMLAIAMALGVQAFDSLAVLGGGQAVLPLVAMQTVGGVILGVIVQGLLFWAMIAYVMPWLGLNLLDMIRDILALNLPERAWRLIGLVP